MATSDAMNKFFWTLMLTTSFASMFESGVPISYADTLTGTHTTTFMPPTAGSKTKHLPNAGVHKLVPEPTIILDYHFGPVMTGRDDSIKLFLIYYGKFTSKQMSIFRLFFDSFSQSKSESANSTEHPTVAKWWPITHLYVDLYGQPVASNVVLAGEKVDLYSRGKDIKQVDIQKLVLKSFKKFRADARSIYLVLTSDDVSVERFCMNVCGTHFYTFPSDVTKSQMIPYGWVGNPAKQCPELCSWPYSAGGFLTEGLIPPNGDIGVDGMIITVGNLLAGIATNPFGNAYFQGDGAEAAGVCLGSYGNGSFPGYPGELLVDKSTNASFNVYGSQNSKFLVPDIWNPSSLLCSRQV